MKLWSMHLFCSSFLHCWNEPSEEVLPKLPNDLDGTEVTA